MSDTQLPDHQPHNHVNMVATEMLHNGLSWIGDDFNISLHKSVQYKMNSSFMVFYSLGGIQPTKNRLRILSIGISWLMKALKTAKLVWHMILALGGGRDCDYIFKSIELLQICWYLNQNTKKTCKRMHSESGLSEPTVINLLIISEWIQNNFLIFFTVHQIYNPLSQRRNGCM